MCWDKLGSVNRTAAFREKKCTDHWGYLLMESIVQLCWKISQLQSLSRVGTSGEWDRRKPCLLWILNRASHTVALSWCWVVRSSCRNCNMGLIKTRCVLSFDVDCFTAMTDVIPWTLALGEKDLRDANKDGHCLLPMCKACWKMTGTKEGTTSLNRTQCRHAGSLPGRNDD